MKSIRWKLALIFVIIWVTAIVADKAFGGEFVVKLGLGAVKQRDIRTMPESSRARDEASLHGNPIGRFSVGYQTRITQHVGIDASYEHFSDPTQKDTEFDWLGADLVFRF